MIRRKIEPKVVEITRELAIKMAAMTRSPRERAINDRRKDFLKEKVLSGKFHTCIWASVKCRETGVIYRVNGQHTSELFSNWEGELPKVYAVLESVECDTLSEVAILWAQYDNLRSARSRTDINVAYAGAIPELEHLSKAVINVVIGSLAMEEHGYRNGRVDQEEKAALLFKDTDFALWFGSMIISEETRRLLNKSQIGNAMLACWRIDPKIATKFWIEVRDGTNKWADSPSRILNKFLLNHALIRGKSYSVSPHEMRNRCILAWNAYRNKSKVIKPYRSKMSDVAPE